MKDVAYTIEVPLEMTAYVIENTKFFSREVL
jgi:hypothetical protein